MYAIGNRCDVGNGEDDDDDNGAGTYSSTAKQRARI